MLTATYTLVALSVEQASLRVSLLAFQKYVQANLRQQNSMTLGQLQYACDSLNRLYLACRWRKIEMYLIPAIRQLTRQADHLLDELARLNQSALDILRQVQEGGESLVGPSAGNEGAVAVLCAGIDTFCATLLQRLDREEAELFAIARRALGGDVWLNLAAQFWRHDAELEEKRRRQRQPVALTLAPPPAPVPAPVATVPPEAVAAGADARMAGGAARSAAPGSRMALTLAG